MVYEISFHVSAEGVCFSCDCRTPEKGRAKICGDCRHYAGDRLPDSDELKSAVIEALERIGLKTKEKPTVSISPRASGRP